MAFLYPFVHTTDVGVGGLGVEVGGLGVAVGSFGVGVGFAFVLQHFGLPG